MPEVSVIMLSYNHAPYLRQSIESVLSQDYKAIQLLIIDDASTDGSQNIIMEYARKDRRIGVILHGSNAGISRTVNEGINASSGNYIALMASDDVWKPDKLSVQMKHFKNNPDVVQWAEADVIDAQGKSLDRTYTEIYNALLKTGNYLSGQTLIVSREILGDIRFDEDLAYLGDFKFELELAAGCDFLFHPEPLAEYRIHGSNSIRNDKEKWDRDWIRLSSFLLEDKKNLISRKETGVIMWERGRSLYRLDSKFAGFLEFSRAFTHSPTLPLRNLYRLIAGILNRRQDEGLQKIVSSTGTN